MLVVGLSEAGIDFDAPDGQPAHAIFFLLTPAEDPSVQLDLSADIAATFRQSGALERTASCQLHRVPCSSEDVGSS